ncbi:hypothetical protein LTR85_005682 [Meristemomyces frigidus]|nr:hypothetical protein LTR85_005682 [Meristemomyces frigidus]
MADWGMMDKLYATGCAAKEENYLLRWQDGKQIGVRCGSQWATSKFGYPWHVMHRAEYQRILAEEARRLGTEIRLGQDVQSVDCSDETPTVHLAHGETIVADVIVGADGLRSVVRTSVLCYVKEPEESGDLAYRVTIPRGDLLNEADPFIQGALHGKTNAIWWGENMHVVLHTVRGDEVVNLVLVCPDDLPAEVAKQPGDFAEMRRLFEGWEQRLYTLLGKVHQALKRKIWGMEELETWTKGSVALLGDACHPSVPYAASGAAMAVEDGAALGRLRGHFARDERDKKHLPHLLRLYESPRKDRTTTVVRSATDNRELFHMVDGPRQQERDRLLRAHDWSDESRSFPWGVADLGFMHELFGCDTLASADAAFARFQQPR